MIVADSTYIFKHRFNLMCPVVTKHHITSSILVCEDCGFKSTNFTKDFENLNEVLAEVQNHDCGINKNV